MAKKEPEFVGPSRGGPIRFRPKFTVPKFTLPKRLTGLLGICFMLAAVGYVLVMFCFTYIRPNEVGVKEVQVGVFSRRGIHEDVIGPGYAFRIPGIETIHHFPQSVQVLMLTDSLVKEDLPSHSYQRAVKIQTSDGFYVDVDVSIVYRIVDAYKLITTLGPGRQFVDQGILPKAEAILKESLGELTTENFYNSPLRVEKAEMARDALDKELREKGMSAEHVLVRFFEYSDEIQKNIEEKKLQDQLVFKNQSEGKAAKEEAKLKRVTQEGEMNVKVTLQEGEAYKVTKGAEKDLYVRQKEAEADLLVQVAEAKRVEYRNQAMQSMGVERAVAMKMAEVLRGLEVIVVPVGGADGFNPLDLDQMITLFGVNAPAANTKKVSAGTFFDVAPLSAAPEATTESASDTEEEVNP